MDLGEKQTLSDKTKGRVLLPPGTAGGTCVCGHLLGPALDLPIVLPDAARGILGEEADNTRARGRCDGGRLPGMRCPAPEGTWVKPM